MEAAKILKAMVAITMAAMLFESVSARNITVGGSTGWDLNTNLTQWSYSTPIFVNDSLLFIYTPAHDVIEVNESDFRTCDQTSPICAYNNVNGETVITLSQPGPRYFICGRLDHCTVGLNVRVQVLDRPQPQSNASSPNYPANQPKELPPNSSIGHALTIIWELGQLIHLICLYNATFEDASVELYIFVLHAGLRLLSAIWSGTYY